MQEACDARCRTPGRQAPLKHIHPPPQVVAWRQPLQRLRHAGHKPLNPQLVRVGGGSWTGGSTGGWAGGWTSGRTGWWTHRWSRRLHISGRCVRWRFHRPQRLEPFAWQCGSWTHYVHFFQHPCNNYTLRGETNNSACSIIAAITTIVTSDLLSSAYQTPRFDNLTT